MRTRFLVVLLVLLVAVAAFAAFRLLESSLASDVYRERLAEMGADYELLREQYNLAVRRTAVTELWVEDETLTVVIRTVEGELQSLVSPFDPSREIYVDYVILNGRLWIRRVFDDMTAPEQGMVIDPRFIDVDWDRDEASHGKAAYRSLSPGRWVIDVTGDGSLGLARREADDMSDIAPPPSVRRYQPIAGAVERRLGSIRPGEAFEALLRQLERRGS